MPAAPSTTSSTTSTMSSDTPPSLPPLRHFSLDRVLSEDVATKTTSMAGHFTSTGTEPSLTAVVIAEKRPLSQDDLRTRVFNADTKFSMATSNNIYSQVVAECGGSVGDLKLLTVYPATEAHLRKYSRQVRHVIHETPQDYETVTRPFIESQSFNIQWVYNILEGSEEQDRIIFQDPDPETGFVLLPDFKWDQKDLENLYLLAICRRRDIGSLRDLTSHHLPLLRNILEKGQEAIGKKYGILGDQLRTYVHYQPSYYHLHVHFTQLSYSAPKTCVGEAHLLHDIITNIETFDPNYYHKCTLSFTVSESNLLWEAYQNCSSALLQHK